MNTEKIKVGVLISGNGGNLQALIDSCKKLNYPAEIVCVISNKENAYGLIRAKNNNIPSYFIDHKKYSSREEFDAEMHKILLSHNVEIVCCAGFMRILSSWFTKQWNGKALNIHPSLLPNFKGAHAVKDALSARVRITGCSVHMVTEELDSGEVLIQEQVEILENDTEETLQNKIHQKEHIIYPIALEKLANKILAEKANITA